MDPYQQFSLWFDEAKASTIKLPEAVALATATKGGKPSVRFVLMRGYDSKGFCFYTNYHSRKAQELEENPQASFCFHWDVLERQVRIEGVVQKTTTAESDAYWNSRPHSSQISAMASQQSSTLTTREELEARVKQLNQKYAQQAVPRPSHWGGFRLVPHTIEFWQGQAHRLHDRVVYRREGDAWKAERLQP